MGRGDPHGSFTSTDDRFDTIQNAIQPEFERIDTVRPREAARR